MMTGSALNVVALSLLPVLIYLCIMTVLFRSRRKRVPAAGLKASGGMYLPRLVPGKVHHWTRIR